MKTTENIFPISRYGNIHTRAGRRHIIEIYGKDDRLLSGGNEDGENTYISVSENGMIITTYQGNGKTRIDYYDSDGYWTESMED